MPESNPAEGAALGNTAACDDRRISVRDSSERGKLLALLRPLENEHRLCEARLWDFSSDGAGITIGVELRSGERVELCGELHSADYSMGFAATAIVVHCHRVDPATFRAGLRFVSIRYRRVPT